MNGQGGAHHDHLDTRAEPLPGRRAPGTTDDEFVVFRQLVHTENRYDIFQIPVFLQSNLNTTGNQIMFLADNVGIENS